MRLLILEDNVDAAEMLAEALQFLDNDYQIRHVTRLDEAEELAVSEGVEAALIDLSLPDADGCEAAIALRRVAPELALVALTGKEFESVALELVRHGVQDFLNKGTASARRVHEVLQLAVERHRLESRLRRQACYDPLTGVLNRAEAEQQLIKALSHADRTGRCGAVLVIDIDDFKQINDTHGHLAGDNVLKDLTNRLTRVARVGDSLGRIGGDELVLILEGLEDRQDAMAAVQKIAGTTCYQMPVNGSLMPVSTSIGVSIFPDDATSAEKLLELADQAMYSAKRRGKSGFCFAAQVES